MPILWRRIRVSSRSEASSRFRPSNRMRPAVGSISRDMQRTSVDLPEPESPMMTKISPAAIAKRDVLHRADQPGCGELARATGRRSCAARKRSGSGPNSFQTPSQASLTSAVIARACFVSWSTSGLALLSTGR